MFLEGLRQLISGGDHIVHKYADLSLDQQPPHKTKHAMLTSNSALGGRDTQI